MLSLFRFLEALCELVLEQRAAVRSFNRRATLQTAAISKLNFRVKQLERAHRRANTEH